MRRSSRATLCAIAFYARKADSQMTIPIDTHLILLALMVAIISYIRSVPMKDLQDALKKEKGNKLFRVRSQIVCLSLVQIFLAGIPPILLFGFMYKDTKWDWFILWTFLSLACLFFLLHFIVDGRRIFQMFRDNPSVV